MNRALFLLTAVLLLVSCGGGMQQSVQQDSREASVLIQLTAEPDATATLAATSTAPPPTATTEPSPTVVPPTATATVTPSPTETMLPPTATKEPSATPTVAPPTATVQADWSSCPYIGNKNSMKFHRASCGSVKQMKESNKVCLQTREEAIAAGYSPCGNCKP